MKEVNITTTHEVRRDIWVKHPDGTEECIILTGVEFPVREGHVLRLLYAGDELWACLNMATNHEVWLKSVGGQVGAPPSRFVLNCVFLLSLIVLVFAGLWSYAKLSSEPFIDGLLLALAICALPVFFDVKKNRRYQKERDTWSSYISEGKQLLNRPPR